MSRATATTTETGERQDGLPRLEVRWPGSRLVTAVTTRPLDFGRDTGSTARDVTAAHHALRAWAWPRFRLILGATQVHGTRLFRADGIVWREADRRGPATLRLTAYDGFLTRTAGVLLTVGVADCVPVFLAAPAVEAVALLHAGWRGVAGGILEEGIAALAGAYGARVEQLSAWWGPAVGPCCYPVGEEVVEAIRDTSAGPGTDDWAHQGTPAPRVDLRAALTRQAVAAGIPVSAIGASDRCTACDSRLHSYRRVGRGGGRMLAVAGYPIAS